MRDEVYLVTGSSYDGWEDSSWGIVSGETGLAHTGAIVYDQSGNILVTHFVFLFVCLFVRICKQKRTIAE